MEASKLASSGLRHHEDRRGGSGSNPASGPYRAAQRARLLELAADGHISVPIGQTFPLNEAKAAVAALMGRHPYGKLALVA